MRETKNIRPDWISKFQYYYDQYAGKLTRLFGLSEKDAGVYIFMFTQNLFFDKTEFIPYQISSELNKMHNEYIPNQLKPKYNPRDVKESIDMLVSLGFAKEIPNKAKKSRGGNAGKFLYSPSKIVELNQFTDARLDSIQKEIFDLLLDLDQVEDAVGYKGKKS